jgi:hypothetical protein
MPTPHAQPTAGAAGAVADDMNVHVNGTERLRIHIHESVGIARRVKLVSNSAQNFFVSD